MSDDDDQKRFLESEEFLRQRQLIAERVAEYGRRLHVPDFGVGYLTIKEAAELVARDMWSSDALEGIDVPDDCVDEHDPRLDAALSGVIAGWEKKLLAAVESGKLKPSAVRRNIKDEHDSIVAGKTFIQCQDLREWLRERGYETGDVVARWEETEGEIAWVMAEEAASLRAVSKTGRRVIHIVAGRGAVSAREVDEADAAALRTTVRAALTENHRLKAELAELAKSGSGKPAKMDRPLHTKQRDTMLTIIAALCTSLDIDYRKDGASRRIVEATEKIDTPISYETIRNLLPDIETSVYRRRS
jgi:hypothetical protein